MSSDLYWRPAPKEDPPSTRLPCDLKTVIARQFWGHDGSLTNEPTTVGTEIGQYLDGLADAGVEGAAELQEAIREHGRVEMWIA